MKHTNPKPNRLIYTTPQGDNWEGAKAALSNASTEQTEADIAYCEASAELVKTQKKLALCLARKTAAEKKLGAIRSRLAVES